MFKRLAFLVGTLIAIMIVGLAATTAIAGKQTTVVPFTPINQIPGVEFFTRKQGWVDPIVNLEEEFNNFIRKESRDRGYVPSKADVELIRQGTKESKSWKFMYTLASNPNLVVYLLGIMVPDDARLIFSGPGCLEFQLQMPGGHTVTVVDQGILFPVQYNPIHNWLATRNNSNNSVTFTSDNFNQGHPGNEPNYMYVFLPRSAMDGTVRQIQATEKLQIIIPDRTAMFK